MKKAKEMTKLTQKILELAENNTVKAIGYTELIKYALIETIKKVK